MSSKKSSSGSIRETTIHNVSSASTVEDESMPDASQEVVEPLLTQEQMESMINDAVTDWLSIHGPKLFSLECSKFLAREKKTNKVKLIR